RRGFGAERPWRLLVPPWIAPHPRRRWWGRHRGRPCRCAPPICAEAQRNHSESTESSPTMHVSRYLDAAARRHPHQIAVVFGDRAVSYRDLRGRATALAAALSTLGPPGMRVGILCDNRPEYIESYYGVP